MDSLKWALRATYPVGMAFAMDAIKDAADEIDRLTARVAELEAERNALKEALTPSADTKAAYIGEISFTGKYFDGDGNEYQDKVQVPWSATKGIMAMIAARAALGKGE